MSHEYQLPFFTVNNRSLSIDNAVPRISLRLTSLLSAAQKESSTLSLFVPRPSLMVTAEACECVEQRAVSVKFNGDSPSASNAQIELL